MPLQWGARMLGRVSPWTLLASGVVLTLSVPAVRNGLRAAAVWTTAGVLSVADSVRDSGENLRNHSSGIIEEARTSPVIRDGLDVEPVDIGPDAPTDRCFRRHHDLKLTAPINGCR